MPRLRKILLRSLLAIVVIYVALGTFLWYAMNRSTDYFGRVMRKMPGPVVFLGYPMETMWLRARAGTLHAGDAAPDFTLEKLDHSGSVHLAEMVGQRPVVLVFGSYT